MEIRPVPGSQLASVRQGLAALLGAFERSSLVHLAVALGCVLTGAALSALAPLILSRLIDDLVEGAASVFGLVLSYAACLGLARGAAEARMYFHGRAEQNMLQLLTKKSAYHILSLPMRFFDRQSSGALVQTLENGLQGYRLVLQHAVFTILPGLLELTLIAGVLLYILDGTFLIVFSAVALLYGAVFSGGAHKILAASRAVSSARIRVTAQLADSLRNCETVKAYSGEAETCRRLDRYLLETRRSWCRFHAVRFRNGLLVSAIFSAGLLAVLALASGRIAAGAMSPGELVLVSAYMLQIVRPMELLGVAARDLGQGAAFIEKLVAILQLSPEALDKPAPCRFPAGGMAVRLSHVSYAPEGGGDVLQDVSLDIRPGARVALVGASGSGKSTLLRLLLGFCGPHAGEIRIDGDPGFARRDEIAYIPQTPGLFNDTLEQNVGFPDRLGEPEAIDAVLWRVGLGKHYGRGAGEGGAQLSGGERQRAAIARALMRRPRLVLADEPTSALDPETESRILREMETGFAGATLILASHRLRSVRHMDLIVVMSQGRVVETGTHEALLMARGVYADLWRAQEAGRPGL